jgi:hypothetical protein
MGQFARCYISPKEQGHPDASIVETFQETSPNPRTSPRVFVAVPALLQPYRSYAPTDFLFARYSEHRCHFVVVLIATQRLGLATFRNGLRPRPGRRQNIGSASSFICCSVHCGLQTTVVPVPVECLDSKCLQPTKSKRTTNST